MKVFRCRLCGEVYIGTAKPASCPFCGAHDEYLVPAERWELLASPTISDVTRDYLTKALDLEMDNTNFYKAVSMRSGDLHVSGMFKGLSKVEREHASTICKHLGVGMPDSKVGRDKAVDSDSANIEEASRREKRAVAFYGEAGGKVPEKVMKEFFGALAEVESDHIELTHSAGKK